MPVYGKEEHDREMAEKAAATQPADLAPFALPDRFTAEDRDGFARGITAFRTGEFYLAHDLWEAVWHAYSPADRRFLQGLIHIAVGAYHLQCGNRKGCRSQFGKALDKLSPFAPRHWGIAVLRVIESIHQADPGAEGPLNPESQLPHLQKVI
jgi:hypothetical protein